MHHPHAPPVYNGQMGPRRYMEKLAVGPRVNPHMVSLLYPIERNLRAVAGALEKPLGDVTAVILDRPRHADIIRECREAGVRIRLISDGDVGAAIEVAKEGTPVDILLGIGGTPEGVIAAAALKCMGGSMQGRLYPRNDEERAKAEEQGYDVTRVLYADDLCAGEQARRAAGRSACSAACCRVRVGLRPPVARPRPAGSGLGLPRRCSSRRPACRTATCSRACATTPAARPPTPSSCAPPPAPCALSRRSTAGASPASPTPTLWRALPSGACTPCADALGPGGAQSRASGTRAARACAASMRRTLGGRSIEFPATQLRCRQRHRSFCTRLALGAAQQCRCF